ncbi:MAG: VOC family protein [Gammaproteobacteria bacterium]
MPIDRMDHYAIRTEKLAATRDFYVKVIGLKDGPRPDFGFPGHWLYCGDTAVIHLIHFDRQADGSTFDGIMGKRSAFSDSGTGSVDHVAFRASDLKTFRSRLKRLKVPINERDIPDIDLHQVFLEDPNGVTIELNFFGSSGK